MTQQLSAMFANPDVRLALSFIVAYGLGSIPFALIIGKRFYDIDLRKVGSGNLGATNMVREKGLEAGFDVFSSDAAKGYLAMFIVGHLLIWPAPNLKVMIGFMVVAIIGHTFPFYLSPPKGGKGIAVSAGSLLYLMPLITLTLLAVFLLAFFLTRRVSVGSMTISALFAVLVGFTYHDHVLSAIAWTAAILVIGLHWKNIVRLIKHEEPKLSFGNKSA